MEEKTLKIENAILFTEKRMNKNIDKVADLKEQIDADGATLQLLYAELEDLKAQE